ncbi:hypothetical protein PT974_10009 [Cladobotryum mycophilum]|uniref:Uncharacterized protein n=1 Tax=Cladobotryum mycophilum TaxID=491253 RepID=A0ABR0S8N1_9HYPO
MSFPGSPTRHLPPIRSGFSGVIGNWSHLVDPSAPSINSEGYRTRFTEPRLPSLMIQSSKIPPVDVPSEAFKASPPDGSYRQTIPELNPGRPSSHPIEPRGNKRPLPESQTNNALARESETLQVHSGFVHTTGQPVLHARSKRHRAESPKPSSPSHRQHFTTHPLASRPMETSVSFQANQPISEPNSRESVVRSSAVAERPETRPDSALPDSQNNANQGLLDKLISYNCNKIPSNNSSKQAWILNDAERLQEENAERLEREKAEYLRENEAEALREEKADQLREGRADPSWPKKARQSKVRRLQ